MALASSSSEEELHQYLNLESGSNSPSGHDAPMDACCPKKKKKLPCCKPPLPCCKPKKKKLPCCKPKPKCRPCKRKKCSKPGPVMNNGYLNFIRSYRRKHCGLKPNILIMKAAKAWCRMSESQKNRYRRMACKVTKSKRHKRRRVCTGKE